MVDSVSEKKGLTEKRKVRGAWAKCALALACAIGATSAAAMERSRSKDVIWVLAVSLGISALMFIVIVLANCSAYRSFREYEGGRIKTESTAILAAPFSKALQGYDSSRTEQIGDDVLTSGGVTSERTSFRSDVDSTHQSRPIEVITRYPSPRSLSETTEQPTQ